MDQINERLGALLAFLVMVAVALLSFFTCNGGVR